MSEEQGSERRKKRRKVGRCELCLRPKQDLYFLTGIQDGRPWKGYVCVRCAETIRELDYEWEQ